MERQELVKAVEAYKKAIGQGKASEHKGWALLRGENRPCNGVYQVKGKAYRK